MQVMDNNVVLEEKTEDILKKLDEIYGTEKCKDTLRNYAVYLKMRKQGKIKVGTYNVLIENSSEAVVPKQVIDAIHKLLKEYGVVNTSYKYLTMDEVRQKKENDRRKDKKEKKEKNLKEDLLVIDTEKLDASIDYIKSNIRDLVNKYPKKILILIYKKPKGRFIFWGDEFDDEYFSDIISWKLPIEGLTKNNKIDYITKYMRKNNIRIDKKSSFKEKLAEESYSKIKDELLNIVLECKMKNIKTITDTVVKDELKRKYFVKNNEKRSGLEQLNSLIGIESVKKQVEQIVNFLKVNKERKTLPMLHMCFMGNPGTGKTTVARIIGKIFAEMEILSKEKIFIEAASQDLIGEYVGQTAPKTKAMTDKAKGGVLFIDEAYSLSPKNGKTSYSEECIATLLKEMEDKRDSLCVILAGYTNEMEELLKVNPGFESRIQFKLEFPDYTTEELYEIFKLMAKNEKYKLANNLKEVLTNYFEKAKKEENFANARCARNLFEKIKFEQANRVAKEMDKKETRKTNVNRAKANVKAGAKLDTSINNSDENSAVKKEENRNLNLIKKCDIENVIKDLEKEEKTDKIKIGFAS